MTTMIALNSYYIDMHLPLVQIYADPSTDMQFEHLPYIKALMALLRREKTHGWVQHMEELLVVFWLPHGLLYTVVSRVLDIVHFMCDTNMFLPDKVVHFPTLAQWAEMEHSFQTLTNSPAFSHWVVANDGCARRRQGSPWATRTRPITGHSFTLQAIC